MFLYSPLMFTCHKYNSEWTLNLHDGSALLWQKEASDKPPKSEILMFQIGLSMFYFQAEFWAETLILLKDVQVKTSWYCHDVNVHDRHILLIYEKYHVHGLLPFVKVGQGCYNKLLTVRSSAHAYKLVLALLPQFYDGIQSETVLLKTRTYVRTWQR